MADDLTIQRAGADAARFYWEVNNDPMVRAQSISGAPIPWEMHQAWFAASLTNPARHMYLLAVEAARAGVLRFDVHDSVATISIALAPEFRGRGLGSAAILQGCQAVVDDDDVMLVEAYVKPSNKGSLGAFERAGFHEVGDAAERDGVLLSRLIWEPER